MRETSGGKNSDDSTPLDPSDVARSSEILFRIFEFAPDAVVLVDRAGIIVKANAQAHQMFGFARNELVGSLVEVLVPERFAPKHVAHRMAYVGAPRIRTMGAGRDLFGRRKDGSEFPVDIMLSPLGDSAGSLVMGVVRDATERKALEDETRAARETYLREIHHRIKNNLQVISSLLYLQSTHADDAQLAAILLESQTRVKSIALVHEKLYRSPGLVRLDVGDYVLDLVTDVFATFGINREVVSLQMQIDEISLDIDTAIPCGLIVNELVSNALKHAFAGRESGTITVHMRAVGDRIELGVRDDGRGMPSGLDWRNSKSLGLKLVNDLARQLEGQVHMTSENGTEFRVVFSEIRYKDRS